MHMNNGYIQVSLVPFFIGFKTYYTDFIKIKFYMICKLKVSIAVCHMNAKMISGFV